MNEQIPTRFKIGDRIRVIDGTFKGLTGIVDQIDEAGGVLCAMVQVPGRHGPVPVEFLIPQIALDDGTGPPALSRAQSQCRAHPPAKREEQSIRPVVW